MKYIAHKSKSKANLIILVVWILSFLWIIPINFWNFDTKFFFINFLKNSNPVFNADGNLIFVKNINETSNAENKCYTDFETNKLFKIITTIFNFYLPLFGVVIIYSKIFITIKTRFKSELLNSNNSKSELKIRVNGKPKGKMKLYKNSQSNISVSKPVISASTIIVDDENSKSLNSKELSGMIQQKPIKLKEESSVFSNAQTEDCQICSSKLILKSIDESNDSLINNVLNDQLLLEKIDCQYELKAKYPVKRVIYKKEPYIISYQRRNGVIKTHMTKKYFSIFKYI